MGGKRWILVILFFLLFTGCSMTLGKDDSYCEEHGVDFSDSGVCDAPMSVYKARHQLRNIQKNCEPPVENRYENYDEEEI